MAGEKRKAGIIWLKVDGDLKDCVGEFTYNLGTPKREALIGSDRVHGYSETPQAAFIEGEIRDSKGLDLQKLTLIENATVTLELANGKVIVLRESWYAGEGTGKTSDGAIGCRFEAAQGEEVK